MPRSYEKSRQINSKLAPLIQKELQDLLEAKIIAPIGHSTWLYNIVVVRKKIGEIRLCIDFRNLNVSFENSNYPLPNIEHLLQRITWSTMMSFLDGFLGYNQVWVNEDDRHKISFTTPWGNFEYIRMPFGLINASATFYRAMDYEFRDFIGKIIKIYQDIIVFSKEISSHVGHLRKVFKRCRKYGNH
jgi:hypothetical protein